MRASSNKVVAIVPACVPTSSCAGPQCGFASRVAGNPLSEDDQRARLAVIVRAAAEIWL
jgi:hypothetical protein